MARRPRLVPVVVNRAPSAPVLSGSAASASVTLNWSPSTAPSGASIVNYQVYQNGVLVQTLLALTTTITGLTAGLSYSFYVVAVSSEGYYSTASNSISLTIPVSNHAPVWTITDNYNIVLTNGGTGTNVVSTGLVYDPDNDPMSFTTPDAALYRATSADPWTPCSLSANGVSVSTNGTITIAPNGVLGDYQIIITADDGVPDQANDWLYRTQTGPNASKVVWFHNFEHENEVRNFVTTKALGKNPDKSDLSGIDADKSIATIRGYADDVDWDPTDGFAGGGSLVLSHPAVDDIFNRFLAHEYDSTNPNTYNVDTWGSKRGDWARPLAPLSAEGRSDGHSGNGKGVDDPGANGTISRKIWRPWPDTAGSVTAARNCHLNFKDGTYGPAAYRTATTISLNNGAGTFFNVDISNMNQNAGYTFDGDEYWISWKCKVSASRFTPNRIIEPGTTYWNNTSTLNGWPAVKNADGKQAFLGSAVSTQQPDHQIVMKSNQPGTTVGDWKYGVSANVVYHNHQTFVQLSNTDPTNANYTGVSFSWPADTWVTFMMHVKVGTQNPADWYKVNATPGSGDWIFELWYADNGQWVLLESRQNFAGSYTFGTSSGGNTINNHSGLCPIGFNAFQPTSYSNQPEDNNGAMVVDNITKQMIPQASSSYWDPGSGRAITQLFTQKYTQVIMSLGYIDPPQRNGL